jgi:hypothetical protein
LKALKGDERRRKEDERRRKREEVKGAKERETKKRKYREWEEKCLQNPSRKNRFKVPPKPTPSPER